MLKRYIGDKAFYRRILVVAVPIIIQNGISNFVSLLDNIMVGQVGTIPMSGVAIVNQLMFVFNLCVFGAVSGAGIFTAQFFGSQDHEGVRYTFRFKILIGLLLSAVGIALFYFGSVPLVQLYLKGEGNVSNVTQTLDYSIAYLNVMLLGLLPFALSNAYSGTLRECGQTVVPMVAGIAAVVVNLVLNYILIFGHWGAPAMGVQGAALATVISRYVELFIVAGWTHWNSEKNPFIKGAYRSAYIPGFLLKSIIQKGMPLLANEALWSIGVAFINQSYSTRGLDVVAATNITNTLWNLSGVVFLSMGNAVGIIMGQMLGSSVEAEQVRDSNRKLIFTSVLSSIIFAALMACIAGVFPQMYNTNDNVRSLSTTLILVCAVFMPFNAYTNASYFTLRSGGQTIATFLFDSCFVWCVGVPLTFILSRYTDMPIIPLYTLCQATDLIKCAIGVSMLRKGKWIQNLVH